MASPLIANVYLRYLFDLWADVWRKKVAKGDVVVVRYADDLVVGFHWKGAKVQGFGYTFGYRRQFALISASYAKLQMGTGLANLLITLTFPYLS